jgi:hypothetical protein
MRFETDYSSNTCRNNENICMEIMEAHMKNKKGVKMG